MQFVVDALGTGSLYALCALGVALVFGVMGLINFAHGELIMVGGYTLALTSWLPPAASIAVTVVAVSTMALLTERVAFRPLRGADGETLLVTSFGVSFLVQSVALLVFGALGTGVAVLPSLSASMDVLGIRVRASDMLAIILASVLLVSLVLFLRSAPGIRMRAAAEDFDVARILGVRSNRVVATAFALSGILAAAVALILVIQRGLVSPSFGVTTMLMAFIAVAIGGIGSLLGAVVGGYVLGLAEVAMQVLLPTEFRPYRDAVVFVIVLVLLVVRPNGLFRVRTRGERV